MSGARPACSVIIPVRGEAATIAGCIEAIARQDIGPEGLEVIVVDGGSADGTAAVAEAALARVGFGRSVVVTDPDGSRPSNLNRGLAEARAPIVCRVDARSRLPRHYVSTCVDTLTRRPDVAVVGGRQRAVAPGPGSLARGMARALNNRWAMGGARYRAARAAGRADTVYLGAFRTKELASIGGWDDGLAVNEDFDLNRRLGTVGAVWFDPALEVDYLPRTSLAAVASQYVEFGRWKVRYWRRASARPRLRQLIVIGAPIVGAASAPLLLASKHRVPALAAVAAAALVIELKGPIEGPRGGPTVHAASGLTSAVIGISWLTGIWAELLLGTRIQSHVLISSSDCRSTSEPTRAGWPVPKKDSA